MVYKEGVIERPAYLKEERKQDTHHKKKKNLWNGVGVKMDARVGKPSSLHPGTLQCYLLEIPTQTGVQPSFPSWAPRQSQTESANDDIWLLFTQISMRNVSMMAHL